MLKKTLNLAIRLLIITAAAGLVLAFINAKTSPIIEEANAKKLAESMVDAFPGAEDIEPIDVDLTDSMVQEVFKIGIGGQDVGYVYRVMARGGYGGPIEFIAGIGNDGDVKGFKVLNHSETPGFGSHCEDPEFSQGITGVRNEAELTASKDPAGDSEIMAITGSTITTNAILGGLNQAVSLSRELQ